MEEYAERNLLLKQIGYTDYKSYLRSKLWKEIRERQLAKESTCYGCSKSTEFAQIQVHHGAYHHDNLTGRTLMDLYTVCSRCHRFSEITKRGRKRNPTQATQVLKKIRQMFLKRISRDDTSVQYTHASDLDEFM